MNSVPIPSPSVLKECIYPLFERLRAKYLEDKDDFPALKSQVMWYTSQGKNVIFAFMIRQLFTGYRVCIVFQNIDGSYEASIEDWHYNVSYPYPTIRIEETSIDKVFYYQFAKISDFGVSFKKTTYEDNQYRVLDILFYETLKIKLSEVLTKAHMEYMAHQSQEYMEEIWQKACHPTVVEKVIATYPSLEAFVNNPDAITPICMLKSILA